LSTSLCLFFQAEDGIRDDLVTGVQTCALPICEAYGVRGAVPGEECRAERADPIGFVRAPSKGNRCRELCFDHTHLLREPHRDVRSEERRVGKERRRRRSRSKKKTKTDTPGGGR